MRNVTVSVMKVILNGYGTVSFLTLSVNPLLFSSRSVRLCRRSLLHDAANADGVISYEV